MLRYTPREFESLTLWEVYDAQRGYIDHLKAQNPGKGSSGTDVPPMTKEELEELMRRFPDEKA